MYRVEFRQVDLATGRVWSDWDVCWSMNGDEKVLWEYESREEADIAVSAAEARVSGFMATRVELRIVEKD